MLIFLVYSAYGNAITPSRRLLSTPPPLPQIVWKCSIKSLKTAKIQDIVSLFSARNEFSGCTDLSAAFDLAFQNLNGDPKLISKYLFVFSDLIHEPPVKSVQTCDRPQFAPDSDFPWHLLEDVSTTVFWVPANQQIVWKKAIDASGLHDRFAMYSTGFSERIAITAPPKPQIKVSDQEREDSRQAWFAQFLSYGKVIGIIIIVIW